MAPSTQAWSRALTDLKPDKLIDETLVEVTPPKSLLEGNLPGTAGEIVEHVLASSRRPNRGMAATVAFAVLGKIFDRKIAGPTHSSTSLYYNLLASTALGKDIIQEAAEVLLTEIGMGDVLGPTEPASAQAIMDRLKTGPSWLYIIDEWGNFLEKMTGPGQSANTAALTYLMRILYSRSAWKRFGGLDRAHELAVPIFGPAVSFIGLSTPEALYKVLRPEWIHDGTLNRMLNLEASPRAKAVRPSRLIDEVPATLLQSLLNLKTYGEELFPDDDGKRLKPRFTQRWKKHPDAEEYFIWLEAEQDEAPDAITEALQGRTAENAVRAATLLTGGMRDKEISLSTIELTGELSRRSVQLWKRGIDKYGQNNPLDHGPLCNLIARTFQEMRPDLRGHRQLDRGEYFRRFGRLSRFGPKGLANATDQLESEGALQVLYEGPRGGSVYRWTGGI